MDHEVSSDKYLFLLLINSEALIPCINWAHLEGVKLDVGSHHLYQDGTTR